MTNITTAQTVSDGDIGKQGYFNGLFNACKIAAVYASTGFNATRTSAATGTASASYEFSALSSSVTALGANYLVIRATVTGVSTNNYNVGDHTIGYAELKIESKPVGGAYATDKTINLHSIGTVTNGSLSSTFTVEWVHTLTASEKSSGVQIKLTGNAQTTLQSGSGTNATGTITNVQTSIYLVN